MSELRPPTRWSAGHTGDAPASFNDAARGYRTEGPDAGARARMWEKLQREVAPAPVSRAWHVPWRGLGAVLLAGTGAMLAGRALMAPAVPAGPQPTAADAVQVEHAGSAGSSDVGGAQGSIRAGDQALDERALIGARAQPSGVGAQPAPPERVVVKKPRVRAEKSAPQLPAASSGDEVALLVRARRLGLQQPARALELTKAHGAQFPSGMFAEERELLAIEALAQLGRHELAKQRISQFLATFPSSAHRRRLETLRSEE